MFKKFNFIRNLTLEVYCRLAPSPIHGVGVFAIRTIPQGIDPMRETRKADFKKVKRSEVEWLALPESVKKLVRDMCPEEDSYYWVPPFSLNEIGLSYYLNHSNTPNMEERDGYFFTMRRIEVGEELTVNYGTYGALNL